MRLQSLGQEDPLKEEMGTHSSILAWRIPRTEGPCGLQSTGVTKSWTRPKGLSTHLVHQEGRTTPRPTLGVSRKVQWPLRLRGCLE